MALGRRSEERQAEFWVATRDLPVSVGHVFYEKLNDLLAEAGGQRLRDDARREFRAAARRGGDDAHDFGRVGLGSGVAG